MQATSLTAGQETNVTDIELMPDGRIFVFGTSWEVLEVLSGMRTKDDRLLKARRDARHAAQSLASEIEQRDPTS